MCAHTFGGESGRVREQLQLTVPRPIADSVLELSKDRFDNVTAVAVPGPGTVLTITGLDQAGERALLNLLWDTGHEVLAMAVRERRSNSSTTTRLGTQHRNGTTA